MDDYYYNTGNDDSDGYEDQTSWNNGGDYSVGNDYNGYDPGGNYDNLDTSYGNDNYEDYNLNNLWNSADALKTDTGPTWNAPNVGGIQSTLANLFQGGINNPLLGKGLSALLEGYQNKQKRAAMAKIASGADPFGSQRPFYQEQARAAVTNPYDSPIVKAQIEQLQNAQSIKDAAAGRRSNMLTSSPAVMAEMARIAQSYQQQMAQQGGANIAPSASSVGAATSGAQAGINGYVSPLLALLGNTQRTATNSSTEGLEALQKFLQGNQ